VKDFDVESEKTMKRISIEFRKGPIMDYVQRPSLRAMVKLNRVLGIPPLPEGRDWTLENCEASWLPVFIEAYTAYCEDDDERHAVMLLILFAYFHRLEPGDAGHNEELWARICRLIRMNRELHRTTVEFLSNATESDPGRIQPLSLLLRELVAQL
jgi:hypothetical protein